MSTPRAQGELGLAAAIREALRAVKYPPYSRDIVSFGLVKEVRAGIGTVVVELMANPEDAKTADQIQAEAERVLQALPQLNEFQVKVEIIRRPGPGNRPAGTGAGPLSPLQEELQQTGAGFDPDPMIVALARPDLAPAAGYGEDGPLPLGGPMGDRTSTKWQGNAPVFQWEIDPSDPARQPYGESEVERDGWIFRSWWQVHPAGLVYASISAIPDDDTEERSFARPHPVGRNVAVNLVYDLRRQGVVAIYGTALDFRPFVEVFLGAFRSEQLNQAGASLPAEETKP